MTQDAGGHEHGKTCSQCGAWKPFDLFQAVPWGNSLRDGRDHCCRQCRKDLPSGCDVVERPEKQQPHGRKVVVDGDRTQTAVTRKKRSRAGAISRNDVTGLIEFSLQYKHELALQAFPTFTPEQIRAVYDMSRGSRERVLKARQAADHVPREQHSPAQAAALKEIATDPSNR